ncbi:MAG: MMPL family transporter, partial [bacterium]|nr:MMPL family transporter [bacterium]
MSVKIPHWAFVIVKLRWLFLLLALVTTLSLGFFATKLAFNFSPDNIYLSSDPAYKFYVDKFMHEFGERANLCIVAIDGNAKNVKTQKALRELHEEFEKVPDVQAVRSIVNTSIYKQIDGIMQMVPVLSDNKQDTDRMIDWVSQDKVMQNLFVSTKGDTPTLLVLLPRHLGDQEATDKVVLDLNNAINKVAVKFPLLKFYLAGAPVLQQDAISTLKADQLLFIPLVALLMAFLLWLSFHSWRGVILPFLATGTATVWTLGWLVLRGHPLDIVNNKLIVLLMVIGTSCAVQFLARFQDELALSRK